MMRQWELYPAGNLSDVLVGQDVTITITTRDPDGAVAWNEVIECVVIRADRYVIIAQEVEAKP